MKALNIESLTHRKKSAFPSKACWLKAVQGTNRCLFGESFGTHKHSIPFNAKACDTATMLCRVTFLRTCFLMPVKL